MAILEGKKREWKNTQAVESTCTEPFGASYDHLQKEGTKKY
jgi:hypothetical protein